MYCIAVQQCRAAVPDLTKSSFYFLCVLCEWRKERARHRRAGAVAILPAPAHSCLPQLALLARLLQYSRAAEFSSSKLSWRTQQKRQSNGLRSLNSRYSLISIAFERYCLAIFHSSTASLATGLYWAVGLQGRLVAALVVTFL